VPSSSSLSRTSSSASSSAAATPSSAASGQPQPVRRDVAPEPRLMGLRHLDVRATRTRGGSDRPLRGIPESFLMRASQQVPARQLAEGLRLCAVGRLFRSANRCIEMPSNSALMGMSTSALAHCSAGQSLREGWLH
jgi:hypothetical protein